MRPEFVTFDCYGTLIDWNAGIVEAFRRRGEELGREADAREILDAYHRAEPAVESGEYRRYREVLTRLEEEVGRRLGWPTGGRRGWLADSLPDWPPFEDTNPALERLAGLGYRLGIVSNVDDDLLAGTRRRLEASFDLLVTAERVRSYKPAPAHFERLLEEVGEDRSRVLHVAQSWFHDVRPATTMGIPVMWVNRLAEERPADEPAPTAAVPDLAGAVGWIERNCRPPAP